MLIARNRKIFTQNNLKTLGMVFVLNKTNMVLMTVDGKNCVQLSLLCHPSLAKNDELVLAQNVTAEEAAVFVVDDSVLESKLFV